MSEGGQCSQAFKADGPILKLLYYEEKNILITVTEGLSLFQHAVMPEGDTKEMMKVKYTLAMQPGHYDFSIVFHVLF